MKMLRTLKTFFFVVFCLGTASCAQTVDPVAEQIVEFVVQSAGVEKEHPLIGIDYAFSLFRQTAVPGWSAEKDQKLIGHRTVGQSCGTGVKI